MNNRIVFTGGPGSGKTSVIEHLKNCGYECTQEAGRKIIQDQIINQGTALTWADKVAFRNEMLKAELINYDKFKDNENLIFFDRSVIDSYGYSMLEQLPISECLLNSCRELQYFQTVFIFPPWRSIFTNDVERKQDFNEAITTYNEMVIAYKKFGYTLIEVPKLSIRERSDFILTSVKNG